MIMCISNGRGKHCDKRLLYTVPEGLRLTLICLHLQNTVTKLNIKNTHLIDNTRAPTHQKPTISKFKCLNIFFNEMRQIYGHLKCRIYGQLQ